MRPYLESDLPKAETGRRVCTHCLGQGVLKVERALHGGAAVTLLEEPCRVCRTTGFVDVTFSTPASEFLP